MTISTAPTDARIKELCGLMRERFSMNPVSCKILNEEWKASFPSEPDIANAMLSLLSCATTAEAALAVREALSVVPEMTIEKAVDIVWNDPGIDIDSPGAVYLAGWNARQAAPPAPAPAVPAGFKLVPVEPTKEMVDAGWCYFMGSKNPSSKGAYHAMLAAAPTPTK